MAALTASFEERPSSARCAIRRLGENSFFHEIPVFFFHFASPNFYIPPGYLRRILPTFTCKRGRIKRGNGGLWLAGDSAGFQLLAPQMKLS